MGNKGTSILGRKRDQSKIRPSGEGPVDVSQKGYKRRDPMADQKLYPNGAGIAGDEGIFKKGGKIKAQKGTSVADNTYVNKTYLNSTPIPPSKIEPRDFTLQYIKSPKYKERLQKQGYKNIDEEIDKRYKKAKSANILYQEGPPNIIDEIIKSFKSEPFSSIGSVAIPKNVIIDLEQSKHLGAPVRTILAHELSHQETGLGKKGYLNENDKKELFNRLKNVKSLNTHDKTPRENKADLNAVRLELFNNGVDVFNKDITHEDLSKIIKTNNFSLKRLLKNYGKKDLVWLLNNIAYNDNTEDNQDVNYTEHGGTVQVLDEKVVNGKKMYLVEGDTVKAQRGTIVPPTSADSAALYKNTMDLLNYYKNNKQYTLNASYDIDDDYNVTAKNMQSRKDMQDRLNKLQFPTTNRVAVGTDAKFKLSDYYRKDPNSPYKYKIRESASGILDLDAPFTQYDTRINPTVFHGYLNRDKDSQLLNDYVSIYGYDPRLIKPWAMRTEKEKQELLELQRKNKPVNPTPAPIIKKKPVEAKQQSKPKVKSEKVETTKKIIQPNVLSRQKQEILPIESTSQKSLISKYTPSNLNLQAKKTNEGDYIISTSDGTYRVPNKAMFDLITKRANFVDSRENEYNKTAGATVGMSAEDWNKFAPHLEKIEKKSKGGKIKAKEGDNIKQPTQEELNKAQKEAIDWQKNWYNERLPFLYGKDEAAKLMPENALDYFVNNLQHPIELYQGKDETGKKFLGEYFHPEDKKYPDIAIEAMFPEMIDLSTGKTKSLKGSFPKYNKYVKNNLPDILKNLSTAKIKITPQGFYDPMDVLQHEVSHKFDSFFPNMFWNDKYTINDKLADAESGGDKNLKPEQIKYLNSPEEIKQYLMQVRKKYGIKPTEVVTPERFKQIKEADKEFTPLKRLYVPFKNDEDIIEMLNKVSYIPEENNPSLQMTKKGGKVKAKPGTNISTQGINPSENTRTKLTPSNKVDIERIKEAETINDKIRAKELYEQIAPTGFNDIGNYVRYFTGGKRDYKIDPTSEESWKQYLGINENPKYVLKSSTRPSISSDQNAQYYRLNKGAEDKILNFYKDKLNLDEYAIADEFDLNEEGGWNPLSALQHFTVSRGTDEKGDYISYYDKWDLPEKFQNRLKGTPFEFYNRMYIPKKKYHFDSKDVYPKVFNSVGKKIVHKIGNPIKKGNLIETPYQDGGVIQDDRGQWAYPGEVTQIDSPYITMYGVPYPVLGISDTGDQQLMMPGEDYEYDGNSVTEYPIMKRGGKIKAQPGTKVSYNGANPPAGFYPKITIKEQPVIRQGTKKNYKKAEPTAKEKFEDVVTHPAAYIASKIKGDGTFIPGQRDSYGRQESPLDYVLGLPGMTGIGAYNTAKRLATHPINTISTLGKGAINLYPWMLTKKEVFPGEGAKALEIAGDALAFLPFAEEASPFIKRGINRALLNYGREAFTPTLEGVEKIFPKGIEPKSPKLGQSLNLEKPDLSVLFPSKQGMSSVVSTPPPAYQIPNYYEPFNDLQTYERWAREIHPDLPGIITPEELKNIHKEAIDYFLAGKKPNTNIYNFAEDAKHMGMYIRNKLADRIPSYINPRMYNDLGQFVHVPDSFPYSELPQYFKTSPWSAWMIPENVWNYDISKLTPHEINVMKSYARGYDSYINDAFRYNSPGTIEEFYRNMGNKLNEGILKNKFAQETAVRRGILSDYNVQLLDPITHKPIRGKLSRRSNLQVGDVFKDEGPMSTSFDPNHKWGEYNLAELIKVPGGGKQSYAFPNSMSFAPYPSEREVILPKGLIRRVTGVNPDYKIGMGIDRLPYKYSTEILNPYRRGGFIKAQDGTNVEEFSGGELPEVTVTAKAPEWLKSKKKYETKYDKDWYIDNALPKFSRRLGVSSADMSPQTTMDYNRFINDKVVEDLFKSKPNFKKQYSKDRLKALSSLTPKELELIKNSSYAYETDPSIWQKFGQGVIRAEELTNPVHAGYNLLSKKPQHFNFPGLTEKEAREQSSIFNLLQPLRIPAKIVQSAYKPNYTLGNAFSGVENNAIPEEEFATDPLNLIGTGIYSKGLGLLGKGAMTASDFVRATELAKNLKNLGVNKLENIAQNVRNFRPNITRSPQIESIIPVSKTELKTINTFDDAGSYLDNWTDRNRLSLAGVFSSDQDVINRFRNVFDRYNVNTISGIDALSPTESANFNRDLVREITTNLTPEEISRGREAYINLATESAQRVRNAGNLNINKSGLTKDEILQRVTEKDKDFVSKMTPEEFSETVIKPTGEVVPYIKDENIKQIYWDQNRGVPTLHDAQPLTRQQYADIFNQNIDKLNELIKKYNRSGHPYEVVKLEPNGTLHFKSPYGESYFSTKINPAKWKGTVEDIANSQYYESIPGLDMSNSGRSVWGDVRELKDQARYKEAKNLLDERRRTGTYEAINEYLKSLDLGRVKPGFNSQSQDAQTAWEKAVKLGKAFGHYGNRNVIHGAFKKKGGIVKVLKEKTVNGKKQYLIDDGKPETAQDGKNVKAYTSDELKGYRDFVSKYHISSDPTFDKSEMSPEVNAAIPGTLCIEGVCSLVQKGGLEFSNPQTSKKRYMSNIAFSDAVKQDKEDWYKLSNYGLTDYMSGDIVQFKDNIKSKIPHHAELIRKNADGTYTLIDNAGNQQWRERTYTKQELDSLMNSDVIQVMRPGYKNDYEYLMGLKKKIDAQKANPNYKPKYTDELNTGYAYRTGKDEDETNRQLMKYIANYIPTPKTKNQFSEPVYNKLNDESYITNVARSYNISKKDAQDIIKYTYGVIKQESDFNPAGLFKGTLGLEGPVEYMLAGLRNDRDINKKYYFDPSSGYAQIKFNNLTADQKIKYDIRTPQDLYDYNKSQAVLEDIIAKNYKYVLGNFDKIKKNHPALTKENALQFALYMQNAPQMVMNPKYLDKVVEKSMKNGYISEEDASTGKDINIKGKSKEEVRKMLQLNLDKGSYPTKVARYADEVFQPAKIERPTKK